MATGIVPGVPAPIQDLIQKGLLERAFHDGLFPQLGFRQEAVEEEPWPAGMGQEIFMTRPGLIKPKTKPLPPGQDPIPQEIPYEQWVARLAQYADTIDVHTPTMAVTSQNLFLKTVNTLGVQAGQSVDRVARNELFRAYGAGSTVLIAAAANTDTSIRVASLNGFGEVLVPGGNVKPQPSSSAFPHAITIGVGGAKRTNTVIGYVPDNSADPYGPGTLMLAAAVGGSGFVVRTPVKSNYGARILRTAAGDSVDAIGAGDTLTLQTIINACAFLRDASVPPHDDGLYHAHISALANAQFFADPVFQRLNQSMPDGAEYSSGWLGSIAGVGFFQNNESPHDGNSGTLTPTYGSAQYAEDIGAEVTNANGIRIGRVILTGKGALYEKRFDESNYLTEAGVTGKIGEFDVQAGGASIDTRGIRMILRSPLDRMQQKIAVTWSITTSFPTPSDATAPSGPQRYKRGLIVEHAL